MQGNSALLPHPIDELLTIMARLRDPQQGCPWDIKQTWQSIIPHTLEEVYEVADAVDRHDAPALCDELGDLLLQIVFMARIAQEQGLFNFTDVVQSITAKMVRRHPHVFADTVYPDEKAQKQAWETIKHNERNNKEQPATFFDGIPHAMPALRRSQKLQQRAAQVGFDWGDWRQVIPKIEEELAEVQDAVAQNESRERVEEEVGDVLMAATHRARLLGINAENALRLSNRKFENRFLQVEQLLQQAGNNLVDASLAQMESAWETAKKIEKQMNGS